jgi:hypothetical protein
MAMYAVNSKRIYTLVYLQCFGSFKFGHLAQLYLFSFRLALGSRSFRANRRPSLPGFTKFQIDMRVELLCQMYTDKTETQ